MRIFTEGVGALVVGEGAVRGEFAGHVGFATSLTRGAAGWGDLSPAPVIGFSPAVELDVGKVALRAEAVARMGLLRNAQTTLSDPGQTVVSDAGGRSIAVTVGIAWD